MDLSIIVVNYKSPRLVLDMLASLYRYTSGIDFEVIVVDNASGDNSEELITTAFPQVKWIPLSYNAGFARGNNAGIRQSTGQAVLLLNSDTILFDNAVADCYRQFMPSRYWACGLQLLNPDGTPQISGNYFMKGSLNNLLPLPYIGPFLTWLGNIVAVKKPNIPDARVETEVDWVNGAFLMVKRQAIDAVGLLDEDFFLYAEETEWCSRIGRRGPLCIFGQFRIIHLQGETANETFGSTGKGYQNLFDRKGLQIMLSNFLRIRKHLGVAWYLFHLSAYTVAVPVYLLAGTLQNLFTLRNPLPDWRRAGQLARNVAILWRYAPKVIANKPYFYKVL